RPPPIRGHERACGERADKGGDGAFDEHSGSLGEPKYGGGQGIGFLPRAYLRIHLAQRALRRNDRRKKHGVRGCLMRFKDEDKRRGKESRSEERSLGVKEGPSSGEGHQDRQRGAEKGRDAVRPNGFGGPLSGQGDRGCLKPVDARRLLVPRLILKPNANEIAALEHLPRGLSVPCLITVHGGKGGDPREIERKADQNQGRVRLRSCEFPLHLQTSPRRKSKAV